MGNDEKVTAIDQLRLHIHDDATFEAPDLEDLLAEIERLSAIEHERDALRDRFNDLFINAKTGERALMIAAEKSRNLTEERAHSYAWDQLIKLHEAVRAALLHEGQG